MKVNESFIPFFECQKRYAVLLGGAGSGKSKVAVQKIISRILTENKHRILCIRKVAATLRNSIYQNFVDQISELDISSEFSINKSEMRFTHKPTGNEIILAGMDDPEKIKSITGITSVWCEEATELNEGDFNQLELRVRGETVNYKQYILTFNPISENHWLKKRFFEVPDNEVYTFKSNYRDNAFLDDQYIKHLTERIAADENLYRVYTLGEWGKELAGRPFAYAFNKDIHIGKRVFDSELELMLSFDFNKDPISCVASQHGEAPLEGRHRENVDMELRYIKQFKLANSDIYALCEAIKTCYDVHNPLYLITGDATGRARSALVRGNLNYWKVIKQEFEVSDTQIKTPGVNPAVKDTRVLINSMFQNYNVIVDPDNCPDLIADFKYVEVDEKGDLMKDRTGEYKKADLLDCARYNQATFFKWFLKHNPKDGNKIIFEDED